MIITLAINRVIGRLLIYPLSCEIVELKSWSVREYVVVFAFTGKKWRASCVAVFTGTETKTWTNRWKMIILNVNFKALLIWSRLRCDSVFECTAAVRVGNFNVLLSRGSHFPSVIEILRIIVPATQCHLVWRYLVFMNRHGKIKAVLAINTLWNRVMAPNYETKSCMVWNLLGFLEWCSY